MNRHHRARRLVIASALLAAAMGVSGAAAHAFEPPADPNGLFESGPAGHPGANGQTHVFDLGRFGAWNAHFSSDQIGN